MKYTFKILLLTLLISVLLVGCTELKPPIGEITVNGNIVSMTTGSYSWSGLGRAVNADSDIPPKLKKFSSVFPASPGAKIPLLFSKGNPTKVEAYTWDETSRKDRLTITNSEIILPIEPGEYNIEVTASWKEGTVTYAFFVNVK